jgi:hypothetical protein
MANNVWGTAMREQYVTLINAQQMFRMMEQAPKLQPLLKLQNLMR